MRSILRDLAEAARGASPRPGDPIREARAAVLDVLQILIGTRRGTAWPARDFGIDDPTAIFLDYPGSVEGFCRDLAASISRYEPRLQRPSVTHVPTGDLLLRIDIEATLLAGTRRIPVRFTSRIDGAWNAEVS